jgi:hypothetical protein
LSRLLDRGLHPEGDDWNTCDSYRDYPGIQMIYAHLDKQMDDRGRIIAALQLDGEDQHGLHNNMYTDSAYIPDDIWQIDGQRLAPGVHPSFLEANNRSRILEQRVLAGMKLDIPLPHKPTQTPSQSNSTTTHRSKVIFQNEQGNILLMLRESGMYALPTWIQPTETDDFTPYAKCPLPSPVMDCIDTAKVAVRHVSALPTSNHTAYRLCKVSNTSDFSSTLLTPIKWVPLDSLPIQISLEDLMYLHSTNYPDFSDVTYQNHDKISDPSLLSWSHESSHRNRSYIPEQHSNLLSENEDLYPYSCSRDQYSSIITTGASPSSIRRLQDRRIMQYCFFG